MNAKIDLLTAIKQFHFLIDTIPSRLSAISETEFNDKPIPTKWSKKEILGHLIDSATNNHQRFIRVQYETLPTIFYDPNKWNEFNYYQSLDNKHLITFWTIYNTHLLEVIKRLPTESLSKECNTGNEENVTLEWLITDYVQHMEHHLEQIFDL